MTIVDVVMQAYAHFPTGIAFKAHATHVLKVNNGKLTHFFQAVDIATINS